MKRKLVKQGKNALTTTLPAQWTQKYNLQAGDEINIQEHEKKLIITTGKEFKQESIINIDASKLNDILIWTYIIAAYRKGADEIKIKYEGADQFKLIQKVTDALLGFAIIDQKNDTCRVKDLSGTAEAEFDEILRRIFILLKDMTEGIEDAIKTENKEILENMEYQDFNINKFSNYCLRILSKKGYKEFDKTSLMHYIVSELENLGDEYVRLSIDAARQRMSKDVIKLLEEVNKFFIMYYHFFYKFDKTDINRLVDEKNRITNEIEKMLKTKKEINIRILYHLSKIMHLIVNIGERQIMLNL